MRVSGRVMIGVLTCPRLGGTTVSGGALVGAFYLHLKNPLENRTDGQILDDDYVAVVRSVEPDLVAGAPPNMEPSRSRASARTCT